MATGDENPPDFEGEAEIIPLETERKKRKRPRGNTPSAQQVRARLALVTEMWSRGEANPAIYAEMAEKHGCSQRTTDRYLAEVKARCATKFSREEELERFRADQLRLVKKLERLGEWGALATIRKQGIQVFGLKAPEKHEVKAVAAVAQLHVDPSSLGALDDAALDLLEQVASKVVVKALQEPSGAAIDPPGDK